jgi:hypothetical protein
MKALYRATPRPPLKSSSGSSNNFCVGRMLTKLALVNIGAVADLETAKKLIGRLATRNPGSYIIFNRKTRRVQSKVISHARA